MKERGIMNGKKEHYGIITAITMIIGIVIGSGIFFKSDDILLYTGGNVILGVLVLCLGAFSIIFGSLSLVEMSIRSQKNGGIVGYYEEFISRKAAAFFGWFQTFVYFPALIAVISWVSGIYTCSLFELGNSLEIQIFVGFIYLMILYIINCISIKLGGYFQTLTTIIKLIPLFVIAIVGVVLGSAHPEIPAGITRIASQDVGFKWIIAIVPIAFSYDGWIIATTITDEVKNPKKTMPLALIIGPLIVLGVYLLYFLGITDLLGNEYIMSTGNEAINQVGYIILGDNGSKILMIFIIISILGVANGLILGIIRMPQVLASKNLIPLAKSIEKIHPKFQISTSSALISFLLSLVWIVAHYLTQKSGILGGSDVSEIAIVFSYGCYIVLYIKIITMFKEGIITSKIKGILCPIFGIIGSLFILVGGFVSNPLYATLFIALCILISSIGYYYTKENN
jgi:APA family basic amino acid/polyamine antiporter